KTTLNKPVPIPITSEAPINHQKLTPRHNILMKRSPAPIKSIELPRNHPYLLILFNLFMNKIIPTAPKPTADIIQPKTEGLLGKSSRVNTANCASTNWMDKKAIEEKEKLTTKIFDRSIIAQPFPQAFQKELFSAFSLSSVTAVSSVSTWRMNRRIHTEIRSAPAYTTKLILGENATAIEAPRKGPITFDN